jgi:tRNA (Thr-GGU) A37 N-methylase
MHKPKVIQADVTLRPIGTIATPYSSKYASPRQPGTSGRRVTGAITLNEGRNF